METDIIADMADDQSLGGRDRANSLSIIRVTEDNN